MSVIGIARSEYENAYENLKRVVDLTGPLPISDNDTVVIKINMCSTRTPETGAVTHPKFLNAVLRYLRENFRGLEIHVVESDSHTVLADLFIKWLGFLPVLKRWNAKWVNLGKEKIIKKRINGRYLKEVPIPVIFQEAFFISLPKLKTNILTGITCCLKNQFGCLPMVRKNRFHQYIDDVIADVNLAIRPDFCIVDGIISMGGELGPGLGIPIPLKAIICGKDPVAIDAFCAKIMGFNPWLIGHVRKAMFSKIGSFRYVLQGNEILGVSFEINKAEMWLLRLGSAMQKRAKKHARTAWRASH